MENYNFIISTVLWCDMLWAIRIFQWLHLASSKIVCFYILAISLKCLRSLLIFILYHLPLYAKLEWNSQHHSDCPRVWDNSPIMASSILSHHTQHGYTLSEKRNQNALPISIGAAVPFHFKHCQSQTCSIEQLIEENGYELFMVMHVCF